MFTGLREFHRNGANRGIIWGQNIFDPNIIIKMEDFKMETEKKLNETENIMSPIADEELDAVTGGKAKKTTKKSTKKTTSKKKKTGDPLMDAIIESDGFSGSRRAW